MGAIPKIRKKSTSGVGAGRPTHGSAPDLESDVRPALHRRTSSLPPLHAPPRRPSDHPAPVDPPTQRREAHRSDLPPARPTVRKSMPIPKAALAPATLRAFPGHDMVEEPLTTRLETKRDKQDSIYGEQTATSRRPMETYEKWLAENREQELCDDVSMDDIATESMEAAVPRKQAPTTERMPERLAIPRRTEVSVNVSVEEVDDEEGLFDDIRTATAVEDDRGSDPVVESSVDDDADLEDESFGDTRNGMPKVSSAVASQPLPLMNPAAAPRITTAMGLGPAGFAPVQPQPIQPQPIHQLQHVSPGSQQIPLQSAQLQALRMQAMQQLQQMHSAQMQSAPVQMPSGSMQSAPMQSAPMQLQQIAGPHMFTGPVVTPGLGQVRAPNSATKSESKVVHRAPWFCLGLMVGVAAMVAAFFMPAARETPVADGPKAGQVAQQQVVQQPTMQQPAAQMGQQQFPHQVMPQTNAPMQPQVMAPPQSTLAPQAAPAQATGPQSKPVPTVDVRTLPIAGQKTAQASAPAPARRAVARPQPAARRAPAPRPLADDDDAPAAAAPKAATPAPSDTVNPDTLLQAL